MLVECITKATPAVLPAWMLSSPTGTSLALASILDERELTCLHISTRWAIVSTLCSISSSLSCLILSYLWVLNMTLLFENRPFGWLDCGFHSPLQMICFPCHTPGSLHITVAGSSCGLSRLGGRTSAWYFSSINFCRLFVKNVRDWRYRGPLSSALRSDDGNCCSRKGLGTCIVSSVDTPESLLILDSCFCRYVFIGGGR